MNYAKLENGWLKEIIFGSASDIPNSRDEIRLGRDDAYNAAELLPTMYWDGTKLCQVKDQKKIWKRLRLSKLSGEMCYNAFKRIPRMDIYPDVPDDAVIPNAPELKRRYNPAFIGEIRPGLSLELADIGDADLLAQAMVASGMYSEEGAWGQAVAWIDDPQAWCVKFMLKSRVLQFEMFHFPENTFNTVYAGFSTHIERRWPLWFWAQLEKPIYQDLVNQGVEDAYGYIRKDRRDWVENIKKIYGSKEIKETDKYILIRDNLRVVLGNLGEWPSRRIVPGWKFEKDGYLVREVTEADLSQAVSMVEASWGTSPRKELALRAFDDDWDVCNSTFLITLYNGEIVACADVREKTKDISALHYLAKPSYLPPQTDISFEGLVRWHKEAGYKDISATIEATLLDRVKDVWTKYGFKLSSESKELVSYILNVDEALNAYP